VVVEYDSLYRWVRNQKVRGRGAPREYSFDAHLMWFTTVDTGCGMDIYRPPLECGTYLETPTNSVRFAHTGGNGVHFSFLLPETESWSQSPVVMTCPANAPPNVIVGKNLTEFLCLGLRTGFFMLERLCGYVEEFNAGHPFVRDYLEPDRLAEWVDPKDAMALRKLAKEFGLNPWKSPGERLEELQSRHLPALTYGEEFRRIMGL
jgi:hypothetical protein